MCEFARIASMTFSNTDSLPTMTFLTWPTTCWHLSAASSTFKPSTSLSCQWPVEAFLVAPPRCGVEGNIVERMFPALRVAAALASDLREPLSMILFPDQSPGSPSPRGDHADD